MYSKNLSDLRFFNNKAVVSGSCATVIDCVDFKAETTDSRTWGVRDAFKMEKNPLPIVGGIVESGSVTRGYVGVYKIY